MGVQIRVESRSISVRLSPLTRVLAVKRRLEIPLHLVIDATAVDRKAIPPGDGTWLRAPGTHIPGLIRYGSYGREPHREFWVVLRQRRVLVITNRDWDYRRVILGTADPDSAAATISAALG